MAPAPGLTRREALLCPTHTQLLAPTYLGSRGMRPVGLGRSDIEGLWGFLPTPNSTPVGRGAGTSLVGNTPVPEGHGNHSFNGKQKPAQESWRARDGMAGGQTPSEAPWS